MSAYSLKKLKKNKEWWALAVLATLVIVLVGWKLRLFTWIVRREGDSKFIIDRLIAFLKRPSLLERIANVRSYASRTKGLEDLLVHLDYLKAEVEHIQFIGADGKVIFRKAGDSTSIRLTQQEAELMKGIKTVHNHPNPGIPLPSHWDINTMYQFKASEGSILSEFDGRIYYIKYKPREVMQIKLDMSGQPGFGIYTQQMMMAEMEADLRLVKSDLRSSMESAMLATRYDANNSFWRMWEVKVRKYCDLEVYTFKNDGTMVRVN